MIRRPDPSLLDLYDALLLDLDGTLMHGAQPIPHAPEAVEIARDYSGDEAGCFINGVLNGIKDTLKRDPRSGKQPKKGEQE